MATHTDYFQLEKPESYENYNIAVFNGNADTIDLQMHNNQVSAAKVMVGATSLADGESGRVPTPHAGDEDKYLKGDGTWAAGNSNVEANPSGTPTATLETIGIDNTIYQLPEGGDTEITGDAEGSVISIDDGKLNEPLKACTVDINPVQSGSGTPSPSNIRPISGWTEANVTRCGKNLYKTELNSYYLDVVTGLPVAQSGYEVSIFIPILANQSIYIPNSGSSRRWFYDKFKNPKTYLNNSRSQTYTAQEDGYIRVTVNKNIAGYSTYQIEYGNAPTTYEPYQGSTTSIPFHDSSDNPITVYGGTLNVTSGELRVTHANIASYNGETINEPWISSMDAYSAGATPTTGAQVVYPLATPTEVSLTPTEITTLHGNNVILADSGDMAITYVRDTSIAINDALNQSITPTYSSGTKIADYNVGGQTGAIYVQGAGGHMDTLWTGDVRPESSSMPTVQLAYPLSGYDYIVVEGYGAYDYYITDTLYKPVIGRTYVGKLNEEINYCAAVTIINDSNVQLKYWGIAGSNTHIVGIYGVKI